MWGGEDVCSVDVVRGKIKVDPHNLFHHGHRCREPRPKKTIIFQFTCGIKASSTVRDEHQISLLHQLQTDLDLTANLVSKMISPAP